MSRHLGICLTAIALLSGLPDHGRAWERVIQGGGNSAVAAVAVDRSGDVIAAGRLGTNAIRSEFFVVKLRSKDGAELWRQVLEGDPPSVSSQATQGAAFTVAVDEAGDVLAGGQRWSHYAYHELVVAKLNGSTGSEVWRYHSAVSDPGRAYALSLDPSGPIFAAGINGDHCGFCVTKLAAANGNEYTRREFTFGTLSSADSPRCSRMALSDTVDSQELALTAAGSQIIRRFSTMGDLRQQGSVSLGSGSACAVRFDNAGDVLSAGYTVGGDSGKNFAVLKWRRSETQAAWKIELNGSSASAEPPDDEALALSSDAAGNAIAAGSIANGGEDGFAVVKLAGMDGSELWRALAGRGTARSLTAYSDGFAAAGRLAPETGELGFASIRVNADGEILWENHLAWGRSAAGCCGPFRQRDCRRHGGP